MLVGVPKEIKDNEYRVGIVPSTVRELADRGHRVLIETGVGAEAGLPDSDYEASWRGDRRKRRCRLWERRAGREGQGAACSRTQEAAPASSPICVSASCPGSRTD